jgi:hypothetical protein
MAQRKFNMARLSERQTKVLSLSLWLGMSLVSKITWGQEALGNSVSVYSIQGACASQGQFSANALELTKKIRDVVTSLKDNPSCKALAESTEASIKSLETAFQTMNSEKEKMGNLENLGNADQEISTLRTFVNSSPVMKSSVIDRLLMATLSNHRFKTVASGGEDIERKLTPEKAALILNAKQRIKSAGIAGINTINTTFDAFAQSRASCLDEYKASAVTTALTQMAAAIISNGGPSAANQQVATAVNKIVNFVSRDKKYIDAIRKLNEREFYSSLSCLVEITSEGMCAARDAQALLDEVKRDYVLETKTLEATAEEKKLGLSGRKVVQAKAKNFRSLLENAPMAGHFILTNQIPIITDWLNKLQFGSEPQLPAEATFQIETVKTGMSPFIQMLGIMGEFNKKMAQLKNKDISFSAKQNLVLEMLGLVTGGFARAEGENFFTRVHAPERMPFALLGIAYENMPQEVFDSNNPARTDALTYIQLNYQTKMPQFKDPDALALIIKRNADDIFNKASILANQYYLQFFIPDEEAVINESMVGINKGDVRSALMNIDSYLEDFIERMGEKGGDPSNIQLAMDTRNQIRKVLAKYKQLHEFGMRLINDRKMGKLDEAKFIDEIKSQSKDFISTVYQSFNISKMRSGWLAYRMLIIVKSDYAVSVQNRNITNKFTEELLLATGLDSLQQLLNQAGVNLATAQADLAQAQNIYKVNLEALEKVVENPLATHINRLRLIVDPRIKSTADLWKEANKYTWYRYNVNVPGDESWAITKWIQGMLNNIWSGMNPAADNERYAWPKESEQLKYLIGNRMRPDLSGTQSAYQEYAKLCTQVLAFHDLRPYWYICQNSALLSPFALDPGIKNNPELSNMVFNYLSVPFVSKAYEGLSKNASENTKLNEDKNRVNRICALREHYRRNYVVQVTAGLSDDKRDNR